jgi:hypothetical protein
MQAKLEPFEMRKKHQNEASQSSLLILAQTPVRFHFSKRIHRMVYYIYTL